MAASDLHRRVATIVRDAGGRLVGRTRLQKVAYLSQLAGFGADFEFEYRHFGPYSDDLANATRVASALDLISEEESRTDWGGWYSTYSTNAPDHNRGEQPRDERRSRFVSAAANIGAIELELAATAAFLHQVEGISDAWTETARRKPDKARNGRLERAKTAYNALRALDTPRQLPDIP